MGLSPKHQTPPIHSARLGQSPKKPFFSIFGALKHHEMARYDLPTYVLHVLRHFWMFAVKITEWLFSLKSLGLWTHLPIVWDKVPNKFVFFLHLPLPDSGLQLVVVAALHGDPVVFASDALAAIGSQYFLSILIRSPRSTLRTLF